MANTTDAYNLNKQLKKEKELDDNNMTAAYANQLYGTSGDAATVGASSSAAGNDLENYLANQNNQLSSSGSATKAAATKKPIRTVRTGNTDTTPTQTEASQPAPQASTVDYSGLSEYDQKLSDEAKNSILQYRQQWTDANARGDTAAMQEAAIQAQLVRAKYGGYISDTSNGMGYVAFGYGNLSLADRSLPQESQDEILYWQLQYMNAKSDADRKYANDMANAIRKKAGYTSTDGTDYKPNDLLSTEYEYTGGDFIDPYADQTAALTDFLSNDTGWDAASYDPATDAAYQSYANYYNRNGQAAANSALAQAAGNTGGIANSYAQALASAAQQSYAKQLTDVIPTLQANAQQSYNNNIANKQALLNQYTNMSNNAYGQYNTNRSFDYNTWLQNWQNAYNMYNVGNQNNQNALDRDWQTGENALDRELDRYLAQLSL